MREEQTIRIRVEQDCFCYWYKVSLFTSLLRWTTSCKKKWVLFWAV